MLNLEISEKMDHRCSRFDPTFIELLAGIHHFGKVLPVFLFSRKHEKQYRCTTEWDPTNLPS